MPKVKIELDLDVVQEAIKAEVAPAVRDVLAQHYDIKAMIVEELVREPSKVEQQAAEPYRTLALPSFWGGVQTPQRGRLLVAALVREAISDAAKAYIDEVMAERQEAIDAAFRKMMAETPDRLVKAFAKMIEGADLELELSTKLSIKDPPRDYGCG